jgi:flagellar basal-body rod protein FlgF
VIASFYSSAAGMLSQIEQQDAISNNLANCDTSGYKRQRVGFSAFSVEMSNALQGRPTLSNDHVKSFLPVGYSRQDMKQGEVHDTGSATNLAIHGPGYFVVKSNDGQQRLTRDGSFQLDSKNRLVTSTGELALGKKGPIGLSSKNWEVDTDGTVKVDGVAVDKLRIDLSQDAPGSKPGRVVQGEIESSNVSAVEETTDMIVTLRAYEANQRVIQAIDQTLDKIINQAGKSA